MNTLPLSDAVAVLDGGISAALGADVDAASDAELLDAAVALQAQLDRLAAVQLAVIERIDARRAYESDAAVTTASWLRGRTRIDHGDAKRRCDAARRLRELPLLRQALRDGAVRMGHVVAVTHRAMPWRMEAVQAVERALVDLARAAAPADVRAAMTRLVDIADDDGAPDPAPPPPPAGPDPDRGLDLWQGLGGMLGLAGDLDRLDGEALRTALDALMTPDPPGTPAALRRTARQRRADALGRLARLVLDAGLVPTQEQGVAPHFTVLIDLARILGVSAERVSERLGPNGLAGLTRDQIIFVLADLLAESDNDVQHDGQSLISNDCAGDVQEPTDAAVAEDGASDVSASDDAVHAEDHRSDVDALAERLTPSRWRPYPDDVRFPYNAYNHPTRRQRRHERWHAAVAGPPPDPVRLRWSGPAPPEVIGQLLDRYESVSLRVVLTAGPFRPVNIGRTMRCHPAWMRHAIAWRHGHCRGPDCDRPPTWTQAHHATAFVDGGETDAATAIPLCQAHHTLVTSGRWRVTVNPDTGACTWTDPSEPDRVPLVTLPWSNDVRWSVEQL